MSYDTSMRFNFLTGRDTASPHMRTVAANGTAMNAALKAASLASVAGMLTLGAAIAGVAAHAIALGQSAIVAAGAVALLPAAVAGLVGIAIAGKAAFSGLGEAFKATGAAAGRGGGAAVDVAHRIELANRSVRDATYHLADAQREALSAQEALTRARRDAAERLEDLALAVAQSHLDERSAVLAVEEARRRLGQARGSGDPLEIRRAQLAYEESVLALKRAKDATGDLAEEQKEAAEKGVDNADSVQAAARRQEDSQRALTAATERLADAQRALAEAGRSAGGAMDKAREALAALAPSARDVVLTMRALAPAWSAAGKAAQQATFVGVAGDLQRLSDTLLPSVTRWLGRMGEAFNAAIRNTLQLASTTKFAADLDATFHALASTTSNLAEAIRPIVSGVMQFVTVGAQMLPDIAVATANIADRFEAWAVAARESGRMQQWMTSGLATLKQFWELAKNLTMSVVALFRAGENTGTLEGLVAGSAAMRAWMESAEGQQRVADFLGFLRSILTDLGSIVPAFTQNSGALFATLRVGGTVMEFLAGHLDTFAALLPTIVTLIILWKGAQTAANLAMVIAIPLRVAEFIASVRSTHAMRLHTAALAQNTAMMRASMGATIGSTVATTAGDVATKRSIFGMIAARTALIAGTVASGAAAAVNWILAASTWAVLGPILLVIAAIAIVIVIVILVIKYHKELGVWIGQAWDWILAKLQAFGSWLVNVLAPMVLNALLWPYRMAWEGIQWVWGKIQEGAAFARDFVIDKLTTLVNFVVGMPRRMGAAAAGLWDALVGGAKAAFNSVARFWNNSVGSVSLSVPGWVPGMGGKSVSFPKIPLLDVGGSILQTGLAIVHEGEEIVPPAKAGALRQNGGTGGTARLVIGSDGSQTGRALVELIRGAVRSMGGDFDIVFEP